MIRFARPADAAAIAEIYAPAVRDESISFELIPPEPDEMARRVSEVQQRYPWLVCELHGAVVGYAYAGVHRARPAYRWSVETAIYTRADARRRGVGRALYAALLSLLRQQGYVNAFAGITLPNPGSVRLHEAVGFEPFAVFRRIGFKFGAWHDVGWWSLTLAPHPADPGEPKRIEELSPNDVGAALEDAGRHVRA